APKIRRGGFPGALLRRIDLVDGPFFRWKLAKSSAYAQRSLPLFRRLLTARASSFLKNARAGGRQPFRSPPREAACAPASLNRGSGWGRAQPASCLFGYRERGGPLQIRSFPPSPASLGSR